jgi:hypothetical protein
MVGTGAFWNSGILTDAIPFRGSGIDLGVTFKEERMRAIARCILAVGLVASPAIAGKGGARSNENPATASSSKAAALAAQPANATAAAPNTASPAKPAEPAMETELQQLRDALAVQARQLQEQQQRMQLLEEQLKASSAVGKNLEASAGASPAPVPASVNLTAASSASPLSTAAAASQEKEPKLGPLAFQKIKLGVTLFGDYAFYTDTGFGPQFITQINQPGPANSHFNSFDITRTYLNFFYMPTDAITIRITPNIFRQVDGSSGSIGNGIGASMGGSTNGNLSFRLKYAYVEFNKLFSGSDTFGKDKVTIGSTMNPLVDWEEGLSGYRYAYLVPWNYLSLSSTFVGARIHGPIEFDGKEFLDYDIGVFNTASFHSIEQNDKKKVMGRLTWYPFGTTSDRTGFGVTVFDDYGYSTKTPDTKSMPLNRFAALVSYQTHSKSAQIAVEYDLGRNAFSTGNLFSGATPVSGGPYFTGEDFDMGTAAATVLSGDRTRQQGYAVFGHVKLGDSPFALFGLFEYFQPNTNFDHSAFGLTDNPIDFTRTVGGISYKYNDHLDFAVQDSNFHYLHPQGMVGANDTNAIFLNFQVNY